LLTIIFVFAEMILYKMRQLNPAVLLTLACLETAAWLAYFILNVISIAAGGVAVLGLILSLILTVTSAVHLYFGAKFTHRKRKGGLYQPAGLAHQKASHGVETGYPGYQGYQGYTGNGNAY
jgi:hypothetical protein